MATMNANVEQAQEYHRVTSGGDHLLGYLLVKTPHGDAYKRGSLYHCANCHAVLRQTYNYDYPAMMAAHAPECSSPAPKLDGRPIAVGDYVRWEFPRFNKFAEGEIVDMSSQDKHEVSILVYRCTNEWSMEDVPHPSPGVMHVFGLWGMGRHDDPVMRRITRPVAAQEMCNHPLPWRTSPVGYVCEACDQPTKRALSQAQADVRAHRAIETPWVKVPQNMPPTQMLYDGLTAMQCYMRWGENRACAERGAPLLYALTPAQIAAGRRAYQTDSLNEWSGELRAKVSASDAARKSREPSVLVQLEDE